MADENSATVLRDGQLAVATVEQSGTIVSGASATDATALVQTDSGKQLCVKTVSLGGGGGGGGYTLPPATASTLGGVKVGQNLTIEEDGTLNAQAGGGTVDQTYNSTSTNAQSGTAVAEAIAPALKNLSTGTRSLSIIGAGSTGSDSINIGDQAKTGAAQKSVQIGNGTGAYYSVGVGYQTLPAQVSVCLGSFAQGNQIGAISIGSGTSITKNTTANANKAIAIGSVGYDNDVVVSATAQEAIQLGIGTNSNAKTFQVYTYQLLDGNTGKIPDARLDLTTITGYDATKTQTLKHISGVLQWVDD